MEANATSPYHSRGGWVCPACARIVLEATPDEAGRVHCPGCDRSFDTTTDGDSRVDAGSGDLPRPPALPSTGGLPNLAGYEILDVLGEGGMGIVYKARDRKLGRLVAIKMIRPARAKRTEQLEGLLQRFRREAESVARLQHPRIVQIFAIDDCADGPFYVMEYVEGRTLAQRLAGNPWEAGAAADLVRMLAEGMQAAHAAGIIHRDLKPGNVLLPEGPPAPKITDFGLAKQLDEEMEQTRSGAVMGTPSYMAPEQADGRGGITPAADVHALGAILYEVLTGRPPFKGATTLETLDQVRSQEPVPPSRLVPGVPRDLETICAKCLRKEAHKRYGSAGELAEDLGRFRRGEPILARPTGRIERAWKWLRRHPAGAALLFLGILTVAAAFAAILYDRRRTERHVQALTASNEEKEKARKEALASALQAEAEGKRALEQARLASLARKESEAQRNRLVAAAGQRLLAEGDWLPALLYFAEALALETDPARKDSLRLRLETTARLSPRLVGIWRHDGPAVHVAFARDASKVLSAGRDGQVLVRRGDTGAPLSIPLKHEGPLNHAAFDPEGGRVLAGGDDGTARLWDLKTGTPLGPVLKHRHPVLFVAFEPRPGGGFLTVSGERFAAERHVQGAPVMVPRRIPIGVGPGGIPQFTTIMVPQSSGITTAQKPFGVAQLWQDLQEKPAATVRHAGWINQAAFAPDGKRLVTAFAALTESGGAQMWDLATGQRIEQRLRHPGQGLHAEYSPDGKRIVSAGGPLEGDTGEARLWDAATGKPQGQVMRHRGQVVRARFSPDGTRIVTASADGTARIWDGKTGEPVGIPLVHRDRLVEALWTPDGLRVLTAGADGTARVWDARTGRPLTPPLPHGAPLISAAMSPAGSLLATACRDGTVRLWSLAVPGLEEQRFPLRAQVKDPPIMMRTWTAGTKTLKAQKVLPGTVATGLAFTQDGQRLLVGAGARIVDLNPGGGESGAAAQLETHHLCVFAVAGKPAPLFPPEPTTLPLLPGALTRDGLVPVLTGPDKAPVLRLVEAAGGRLLHESKLNAADRVATLGRDAADRLLVVLQRSAGNPKAPETHLSILEARTGSKVVPDLSLAGSVLAARWSGDGQVLAALVREPSKEKGPGADLKVFVWRLEKRARRLGLPLTVPGPADHLAVNEDGSRVGVWHLGDARANQPGDQAGMAFVWDTATQDLVTLRHAGAVVDLVFDGAERVATASLDRTARVWNLADGEPLTPGLEHRGRVEQVVFAGPDLVITGAADGTARVWDARTGEAVGPPLQHPEGVLGLAYHEETRRLATACADGVVRVFHLRSTPRTDHEWRRLAQCLSAHRLDPTRNAAPLEAEHLVELIRKAAGDFPAFSRPTPEETVAWHRRELAEAGQAEDAAAELFHLDRLLTAPNPDPTWQRRRVDALGRLERWAEAERASTELAGKATAPSPEDLQVLAVLRLRLGKAEAYQETCAQLVGLAEKSTDLMEGSRLLSPLELGAQAPETVRRIEAWLDRVAAGLKETDPATAEGYRLRGIALMRGGKAEEARNFLEKVPGTSNVFLQLLRGVNARQLGRTEEAAKLIAEARRRIEDDERLAASGFTGRRLPWWQRLHLHQLLEEAGR